MVLEPWSNRPKVDELDLTDILMRRNPSQTVKNQEIPFSDVIPFIYENIAALTDGTATITSDAQVGFEQGGSAFRTSFLVNPEDIIAVENQAQLEAKLGVNLEIPDGETRAIHYLKSFTQTKPILLGVGSSLQLVQAVSTLTTTYTGAGAYIQNKTPGTAGTRLFIRGFFTMVGNVTNSIIDAKFDGDVTIETTIASNFQDYGTIDCPFINITSTILIGLTTGIVIKDCNVFEGRLINIIQTGATGITGLTVIGTTPTVATIQQLNGTLFAGDTLLFLDPNTTGRSLVVNSNLNLGDFFSQGTDIAISAVMDNGSGDARFLTAASHGLSVGTPVVLSAFGVETTYNGTFIVTAVDTPITGTTFDVAEAFTGNDTGNMNKSSLDSESIPVTSIRNNGTADSMASAQVGFTNIATPIVVTIVTQDVPVIIGGTQFLSDNLERATATTGGEITNTNPRTKKYPITFSGLIEKVGGGSTDIGLLLIVNGVLDLNATFEIPHSVNAGIIQISATRTFELADSDTIDIAVVNFSGTADISVSQANIEYSKEA